MRKCTLLYTLFFLVSLYSIGQTGRFYSPDEELSNSLINQIYQDQRGFIWIATEYGLNKFDGKKFTIYKRSQSDTTSLKNNYVRSIFEDSNGNFWVGCINGLMRYDWATNSFEEIKMYNNNRIVTPHITQIMEARNGDIWLATSGLGLFVMREKTEKHFAETVLVNKLNSNYLSTVFEDSNENLWIGTEYNGVNLYNPATGEIRFFDAPDGINGNNISSITEDKQGNLFVGTLTHGLSIYNRENGIFQQITHIGNEQLMVKTLHLSQENILYIGTDGQGLKIYDHEKNIIQDYELTSAPFDFSKGKVHAILQDRSHNLWLGVFQKGVIFISGIETKFDYWGFKSLKNNPIGTNAVMSIFRDSERVTWIGTDNDGIFGVNDNGERIAHFSQTASSNSVSNIILSIHEDYNRNLWIGSFTKGLAKLNRRTGTAEYVPELINKRIYCITEDDNKNLLIGTYGLGFYKLSLETGNIIHYESGKRENDDFSLDELTNDWINDILFDNEGLIWLAHYKGVSCYNPRTGSFINYLNRNTILPHVIAYTLYQDASGKIWIGSSDGLYIFDKENENIQHYTTANGLPNNVICGILQDGDENIWLSTYLGISRFNVDENVFTNYFAGDGLQGNEFMRGARFRDAEGRIYFGGIYGVTHFFPHEIADTQKELQVFITDFYLSNHSVRQGDKSGGREIITSSVLDAARFTLSHEDNTFSIEFSAFEYTNPERIIYQYRIEEFDNEWISLYPGVNRVTYTNLSPGTYTFMFRAQYHDNFSETKSVKIVITPPWYQSIAAYVVYTMLLMLLALVFGNYIRLRIKRKQEEMERTHQEQINEAKLQFFINISHEIRTPMTLIINPLEKLLAENKDASLQKTYTMIHRNSQRILRLINQLMDIRKLDKGQMRLHCRETDIVGFIEDLMLTFEYMAQRKNISFNFIHTNEKLFVWVDLNNFDKILLNILSNAFKYTPDNGNITIELTTGHDKNAESALRNYFEITITDSGIGIDKDNIDQVFERFYQINNNLTNSNYGTGIGLHLTRSLVELHHGTIFAESRGAEQGARFVVRIPLGSEHLKTHEIENGNLYKITEMPVLSKLNPEITDATEVDQEKRTKRKTGYHILIVEDEEEIRDYIKRELSADYKTTDAPNGKKALELALKEMPDLIISDVMMPEMDGIGLVRKVKQNININHIPIILLTAKITPENRIEGLDIGADAYISKPFNTEVLKSTIANLIENRERLKNKFSGQQTPEGKIDKIEMKSTDEILMQKIMKIINENLTNPDLSVEMLASGVGMSRVHLHRKLKAITNQSARDFIKGIRLKQAADLLTNKRISISEVAYATGFSNLSHFSSSFKEFYGVAPKEFAG
jgi:signal transduction histidine kinase/ligand-binding sensor domain-containing protein/AraC-like DNA-binding protein